jgi:MFS family permease
LAADVYGAQRLAGLLGMLYTGAGFGALIGPILAGALYDRTGSYTVAIIVAGAFGLVAAACTAKAPTGGTGR